MLLPHIIAIATAVDVVDVVIVVAVDVVVIAGWLVGWLVTYCC